MRLGVFGDIHSNIEALEAVYKKLTAEGCDKIVCTGDIVGYGASPAECIDFIREHKISSARGNHDHYTTLPNFNEHIQPYAKRVIQWMQDTLDYSYIKWLSELPFMFQVENSDILIVHSSLEAIDGTCWPYILDPQTAMFHFFLQNTQFCFYGHTHVPLYFSIERGLVEFELLTNKKLPKYTKKKYLFNPGSVGQPRDAIQMASSVIFDTETLKLTLFRTKYDIESAQKKIFQSGLPKDLAYRLNTGR